MSFHLQEAPGWVLSYHLAGYTNLRSRVAPRRGSGARAALRQRSTASVELLAAAVFAGLCLRGDQVHRS